MDYTVGSLADLISGSNTPNKLKITKKITAPKPTKNVTTKNAKVVKSLKEKTLPKKGGLIKSEESVKAGKIQKPIAKSQKLIKKNLLKTGVKNELSTKKQKSDSEIAAPDVEKQVDNKSETIKEEIQDPEKDKRTIFVGNLSNDLKSQNLKEIFRKYGDIQSVRFRSAARSDANLSNKEAVIKRKFHKDRTSINAYVVFRSIDAAKAAVAANGSLVGEHHIRVDLAEPEKQTRDQKLCIFVGNMPFSTEEETLWKLFAECGEIDSVRVVRDKNTGMCKGIGFINFKTIHAVELALKLEGVKIEKRELRISRCQNSNKGETNKIATDKAQKNIKKRNPDGSKKRKRNLDRPQKTPQSNLSVNQDSVGEASPEKKLKVDSTPQKPRKTDFIGTIAEKKKSTKNKVNKGELKKKKMILRIAPRPKLIAKKP